MKLIDLKMPTMADFTRENIINSWCGIEGKYVNLAADRGGETNFGITKATAAEWAGELVKRFQWNGRMQDLTQEMAFWIYDKAWWQRMRCDEILAIHPFIADRVFDLAINGGRGLGVKTLQRILNACNRQQLDYKDIAADGGVGKLTLDALRAYVGKRGQNGVEVLVQYQLALQGAHYINLAEKDPSQETFVNGWGDRVTSVNRLYQKVLLSK